MLIPIDLVVEQGDFRRTPVARALDDGMQASILALGQLQPIVVRTLGATGFSIVFGRRRLRAMRQLGYEEIEATVVTVGAKIADAMQGAENMVRAPMDAVDQWAVVTSLVDQGYTVQAAGEALGLSLRTTMRLHRLASLAPPLVEAMRGNHLPTHRDLGIIAGATHERQLKAFERHSYADHPADWSAIAGECVVTRIPRSRAIFDLEDTKVEFQEDLFAEPGSDDQFTTSDVEGFMAAQLEALQARMQNSTEPASIGVYNRVASLPDTPKGWTLVETSLRDGDRKLPKSSKKRRIWAIVAAAEMHRAGQVISIVVEQPAAKPKQAAEMPDTAANQGLTEVNERLEAAIDAEPVETGISRPGQRILAEARTIGLQAALLSPGLGVSSMLALMILALSADNVRIGNRSGADFLDLAAALLTEEGNLVELDDLVLTDLAGEAMARMLVVRSPADQMDPRRQGSGAAAEWVGRAVQAGPVVPDLGTPEFLACVNGPLLFELGAEHDITDTRKARDVRSRLVGKLAGWQPQPFGAPPPQVVPWQPFEAEA